MSKFNFNEVVKQTLQLACNFVEITLQYGSSVNLLHIFRILFPKNTSGILIEAVVRSAKLDSQSG